MGGITRTRKTRRHLT